MELDHSDFNRPLNFELRTRRILRRPRSSVLRLLSTCTFASTCALVLLVLLAGSALAQPSGYQSGSGSMSQTPVFKYYVWGQVRNPGAFSLSSNPDILELLSAAGGPTAYANLSQAVLIRASTQKRMTINLGKVLGAGQVVPLSPGDVVIVRSSAWYYFRDGLTVVTSVGTLVILVLTIMNAAGK